MIVLKSKELKELHVFNIASNKDTKKKKLHNNHAITKNLEFVKETMTQGRSITTKSRNKIFNEW